MYDEETEQLSDDLVNITGDIADLTNGRVSIKSDENTYRSIYDILDQIATIWDDLEDVSQARLLEKLFAKTRANTGAAILKNWDSAKESLKMMQEENGQSADAELQAVQSSLSFKLNALKETWTGLWQDLFPRDALGVAIDALTAFSNLITGIIKNLGLLGTALAGLGITKLFKNFGRPKLFGLLYLISI